MKIIELLNKIANEEEMPKKIKYGCNEYVFDTRIRDYIYIAKEGSVPRYFIDLLRCKDLNDEVEIIQESEDIDIQNIDELDVSEKATYQDEARYIAIENRFVINELIRAVKQLDNKINKKG